MIKQNKENIIQVAPNLSPAFQPLVYYQAIISILFDQRVFFRRPVAHPGVQVQMLFPCFECWRDEPSVGRFVRLLSVACIKMMVGAKNGNILIQMNANIAIRQFQLSLTLNFLVQL